MRIFCEMGFKYAEYSRFVSRRISPTEIGRKLGISEKTIRLRIKGMEEEGFVKYYQAVPNLALFGIGAVSMCGFETPDLGSKERAIEYLRRAPMVVEIIDFLGPGFSATLAGNSNDAILSQAADLVRELKLKGMFGAIPRRMADFELKPSRTDWLLIQQLRYDALRPTVEICSAIGMTRRMADYRILKLLESRVFFVRAVKNPRKMRGIIFYGLNLFIDETWKTKIVDKLHEIHGERIWMVQSPKSGILAVNLFAFKIDEPEESLHQALRLEGVRSGTSLIAKEDIEPDRPSWLDRLIKEKAAVLVT